MAEFTKHKVLKREFGRVQLSENDLQRLAKHFEDIANRYETNPSIEIESGDGEETIHTSCGDFFQSLDMPTEIRGVKIKLNHYKAPISCSLSLSANPPRYAELNVDGTDTSSVTAIFHEIEREMSSKQTGGTRLLKFVETFWFHMIVGRFYS